MNNKLDRFSLTLMGLPNYLIDKVLDARIDISRRMPSLFSPSTGIDRRAYLKKILDDILTIPKESLLRNFPIIKKLEKVLKEELEEDSEFLLPVEVLECTRATHAFKVYRIDYLFQLVQLTEADLLTMTNINRKTISIIVESLKEFGLHLGMVLSEEKISNFEEKLGIRNEPFSFEIKI